MNSRSPPLVSAGRIEDRGPTDYQHPDPIPRQPMRLVLVRKTQRTTTGSSRFVEGCLRTHGRLTRWNRRPIESRTLAVYRSRPTPDIQS